METTQHLRKTKKEWKIHTLEQIEAIRQEDIYKKHWCELRLLHDLGNKRIPEQQKNLEQHLYMHIRPKKRAKIIKNISTQNQELPDKEHMPQKRRTPNKYNNAKNNN